MQSAAVAIFGKQAVPETLPIAKIGLEKYFLMKMKRGVSEPFFEKAILRTMGIDKLDKSGPGKT